MLTLAVLCPVTLGRLPESFHWPTQLTTETSKVIPSSYRHKLWLDYLNEGGAYSQTNHDSHFTEDRQLRSLGSVVDMNAVPSRRQMPKTHPPDDFDVVRVDWETMLRTDVLDKIHEFRSPYEREIFEWLYDIAHQAFDHEGFNHAAELLTKEETKERFRQAMTGVDNSMPHCDVGAHNVPIRRALGLFPGGPSRKKPWSLTQWLIDMLLSGIQSGQGGGGASGQMNGMMSMMMIISIVEQVAATLMDIIPPLLPPPIWIMRPFPCLPMLTGINCLGSVLYPITFPDFIMAHTTDSMMDGILDGYPTKYNTKVGITHPVLYRVCAVIYLGMNCAAIFPIAMPVCLPQCIAVLLACPGFWLDDLSGPCESLSLPPFCSFSFFIHLPKIPPQYMRFEDAFPYPPECPEPDEQMDALPVPPPPDTDPFKEKLDEHEKEQPVPSPRPPTPPGIPSVVDAILRVPTTCPPVTLEPKPPVEDISGARAAELTRRSEQVDVRDRRGHVLEM
ncbi:MAG: uncharacterized protein KVP18_005050 [Porospora cf. gigantea A]|uniref:uncharacterized protein n=1 Tax=Porospora cf. gigantea A TaxID=2853593 RepID=UPI00355A2BC2|nr:MAG: hypothetical protein KVP18_005050 [Porospora cf. gigantea A]